MIPLFVYEALGACIAIIIAFFAGMYHGAEGQKNADAAAALKEQVAYQARYEERVATLNQVSQDLLNLQKIITDNTLALDSQATELSKLPSYKLQCFDGKGLALANEALKGRK